MRAILLVLALSACGPKIQFTENYDKSSPPFSVAVLEVQTETDVPQEQVKQLRQTLTSELKSAGFLVLDHELTDSTCTDEACNALDDLVETYEIDGAYRLVITDYSHIGFLLGFYTTVGGKLEFLPGGQTTSFVVSYQESKRGGLLFNSGQVITAISEQIDSGSEEKRDELAVKFIQQLVKEVPRGKGIQYRTPSIASAQVRKLGALDRTEFCLHSSGGASNWISIGPLQADLRRHAKDKYCGVLSNEAIEGCNVTFFSSSKYGDRTSKTVQIAGCNA